MNIRDAIQNAPDTAQVEILWGCNARSGATIFSIGQLRAEMEHGPSGEGDVRGSSVDADTNNEGVE